MPSEKEKMLNEEPYDPYDPVLVEERRHARELTRRFNRTAKSDGAAREALVTELLGSVGEDVCVEPPFRCDYGYNVRVGARFFANFDCVFLDVCPIEIGDNCLLGPGVHVYTATHPLDPTERAEGLEYGKPVSIGDDVWIGGRAVLNPGVRVGDGSMVASGAVVTGDVPTEVVVRGNPAEVVRELE